MLPPRPQQLHSNLDDDAEGAPGPLMTRPPLRNLGSLSSLSESGAGPSTRFSRRQAPDPFDSKSGPHFGAIPMGVSGPLRDPFLLSPNAYDGAEQGMNGSFAAQHDAPWRDPMGGDLSTGTAAGLAGRERGNFFPPYGSEASHPPVGESAAGAMSGFGAFDARNPAISEDDAIRSTNDDAAVSRLSAVKIGYLQDKYLPLLVRKPQRRPPLINRGTYARYHAIQTLVDMFLKENPVGAQVIVLGAGSDTRYFALKENNANPAVWVEADFAEVTSTKTMNLCRKPEFSKLMGPLQPENGGTEIHSKDYHLISCDLRDSADFLRKLRNIDLVADAPTLIIAECVLIYMDPKDSDGLLLSLSEHFSRSAIIVYEQISPYDAFGSTMLRNLEARNINLRGITVYPTLASHLERYQRLGWDVCRGEDMNVIFHNYIDEQDLARISKLELLDEIEELMLMFSHYVVVLATRSDGPLKSAWYTDGHRPGSVAHLVKRVPLG